MSSQIVLMFTLNDDPMLWKVINRRFWAALTIGPHDDHVVEACCETKAHAEMQAKWIDDANDVKVRVK